MKKGLKTFAIVLGVVLLFFIYYIGIVIEPKSKSNNNIKINERDNMKSKINAVIVKVEEKTIYAISTEDTQNLITIGFTEEGDIGYKQYQEIEIYFDGIILESYPAQLGNVGKIEIVKEKSDIEIPENILKQCYSSDDNVNIDILELTCNGIDLNITDFNSLEYNYSHNYKIYEKIKNENYDEEGSNSTSLEYIWQEKDVISNILSEDTEIVEETEENIIKRKFDWNNLYGELESGEYEFVLGDDDSIGIRIFFTIDDEYNVTHGQAEFLY